MSFLLPGALFLGLLALLPILAHALRKGQTSPVAFPATRLVPSQTTSAKRRHKVGDKALLSLRVLLLLCLALLAASPFVTCSRLSLSRTNGASVAAALIIDDSASMRAVTSKGATRLELAVISAKQLLKSARPGDSFSIVLAGYPARVLTPPTSDLRSVDEALDGITPSDRRTDLASGISLARSLNSSAGQQDRPLVLLSDLSAEASHELDLTNVLVPNPQLSETLHNCALLSAEPSAESVHVEIACTDQAALEGRSVRLINQAGTAVGDSAFAKDGAVRIALPKSPRGPKENSNNQVATAELSPHPKNGGDQIKTDDSCPLLQGMQGLTIGLRVDAGKASIKTGSGTVVEAAIEALDRNVRIQSLSLLPEQEKEFEGMAALVIDDPSGFSPEARETLHQWIAAGGVGLVLLGPAILSTPLGSNFEPFLTSSPIWERTKDQGTDEHAPGSLGPLTTTWTNLGAAHRAKFEPDAHSEIKARWSDGAPLIASRALGHGLLLVSSLPASVDQSDLALRPAFLELLDFVISEGAARRGAQATPVGERWSVPENSSVRGPDGRLLEVERRRTSQHGKPNTETSERASETSERASVEPALVGRYSLSSGEAIPGAGAAAHNYRFAMRDPLENISQPGKAQLPQRSRESGPGLAQVEVSREVALAALILGLMELALRALWRWRRAAPLSSANS